jgi:hypothetical protein
LTVTLANGYVPGAALTLPVINYYGGESGNFDTFNSPMISGSPVFTTQINPTVVDLVSAAPAFTFSAPAVAAQVGVSYNQAITVSGGTAPYRQFDLVSGQGTGLPGGSDTQRQRQPHRHAHCRRHLHI